MSEKHSQFVAALFRVTKLGFVHDLDNAAATNTVNSFVDVIERITRGEDVFMVFMAAGETIFVSGEPLKATRQIYENAQELGRLLSDVGYNEFHVHRGVRASEVKEFATFVAAGKPRTGSCRFGESIRLQEVDPAHLLGDIEDLRSVAEQVRDTFATALVLSKRWRTGVGKQDFGLSRHMKRVAQHIVAMSDQGIEYSIAIAVQAAGPNEANQVVHAAFLAALVLRTITRDQHAIMRAVYGCLMSGVGSARTTGVYENPQFGSSLEVQLSSSMRERLPASSAALLLQMSYASRPVLRRVVTCWEADWLGQSNFLPAPYMGRLNVRPESLVVRVCLDFVAIRARLEHPDEVFAELAAQSKSPVQVAACKLLCDAIGYVPRGSYVVFEDGSQGIALSTPAFFNLRRPEVVLLLNSEGSATLHATFSAGLDGPTIQSLVREVSPALAAARQDWASGGHKLVDTSLSTHSIPEPDDVSGSLEQDRSLYD